MPIRIPVSYFGSIEYWRTLVQADAVVFEIEEKFVKQSIRTRTKILSANGLLVLSVPVLKTNGTNTLIKELLTDEDKKWRKEHLRSIKSAYANAPFFEHYERDIVELFEKNTTTSYLTFVMNIFDFLCKTWGFTISSELSNHYELNENEIDLRSIDFEGETKTENYTYYQVDFGQKEFSRNLSVLDLLFNLGPMGRTIIK